VLACKSVLGIVRAHVLAQFSRSSIVLWTYTGRLILFSDKPVIHEVHRVRLGAMLSNNIARHTYFMSHQALGG
jgi:hypothetical protein